jgi:hypothetical protein
VAGYRLSANCTVRPACIILASDHAHEVERMRLWVICILGMLLIGGCKNADAPAAPQNISCELEENWARQECAIRASVITKNSMYCDRAAPQDRDACYRHIARLKSDPMVCSQIVLQAQKDKCHADLARITRNLSLCDQVVNQTLREGCLSAK